MSRLSSGLLLSGTLAAGLAAMPASAADTDTTCSIDDDLLTINVEEGDFSGQTLIIGLNADENGRVVNIGDTPYTLIPTDLPGSTIEAAGDINKNTVQLNNERGKGGLSHKFFASYQQPQWQMMAVGIPEAGGSTITFETSDHGGFSKQEIECSGGQSLEQLAL